MSKSCVSTSSTTKASVTDLKKIPSEERDFWAEDQARTGHPDLGKVVLYQMSYFRLNKNYFLECENKESTHTNKIFFYLYSGLYWELVLTSTSGFSKPELNNLVQLPKTNDNSAKTDI